MGQANRTWKKIALVAAAIVASLSIVLQILKYRQIHKLYEQAISFCAKVEKGAEVEKLLALAKASTEKGGLYVSADRVTVKFERSSGCTAEIKDGKVSNSFVYYND
ncbi:MAG: hypothetical protein ACXWJK_08905 [Burkholderiaceae bacterium]